MSAPSRRHPSAAAAQALRIQQQACAAKPRCQTWSSSRPNDLSCSRKRPKRLLGLRVGRHDRHPSIAEPGRAREQRHPTNRQTRSGSDAAPAVGITLTSREIVKPAVEAHQVLRPKATKHLNLFGLARAARLPFRHRVLRTRRDSPAKPDAEPGAVRRSSTINLGRLLGNQSGLSLRRDQDAARQPDAFGDCRQKAEGNERSRGNAFLFVVERRSSHRCAFAPKT